MSDLLQIQYQNIDPDRDFQSMEIIELLSEPTCSSLPLKREKSNREIILYVPNRFGLVSAY